MQNTEPKEASEIVAEVVAGIGKDPTPAATNFYEWIVANSENPADDPAGDFATDAAADRFFPRNIEANAAGFAATFNYLYFDRHADSVIIDAFIKSWRMFYKAATGRGWISDGKNERAYNE